MKVRPFLVHSLYAEVIWSKIEKMKEYDIQFIEDKLTELKRKSRKDEDTELKTDLKERYLKRKNKFGRFEN